MDVTDIASLGTAMSNQNLNVAISDTMLKKAIDIQANDALLLVEAIPPVQSLPPNLGNNIDVTA
jgi:Putative motility protein